MKDMTWLDQLKVRLGVGVTGNSAVNPYGTLGLINGEIHKNTAELIQDHADRAFQARADQERKDGDQDHDGGSGKIVEH